MITISNRIELGQNSEQINPKTGLIGFFNIDRNFPNILQLRSRLKESKINGNFSDRDYKIYFLIVLSMFLTYYIVSVCLFPDQYKIVDHHISSLGSLFENPLGHPVFNIGSIITGIFIVPNFLYLRRKFSLFPGNFFSRMLVKISIFLCLTGSFGMSFVGIFPQEIKPYHSIAAAIAFGSFFFAQLLSFLVILFRKSLRSYLRKKKSVIVILFLIYSQSIIIWILCITTLNFNGIMEFNGIILPFWEWSIFFSTFIWILSIPFVIKKRQKDESVKKKNVFININKK